MKKRRENRMEEGQLVNQKMQSIGKEEVGAAMKSRKAAGKGDITVKVWSCQEESTVEFLTRLFKSETMPKDWRRRCQFSRIRAKCRAVTTEG